MSNWIPITSKKYPRLDQRVLVTDGDTVVEARYGHYKNDRRTVREFRAGSMGLSDVTHWMPLPEPPTT